MTNRVVFPWPTKGLWSNDRTHWAERARAVKDYRRDATILAQAAGWHRQGAPSLVRMTFCPKPLGKAPDRDNCIGAAKALQDALAAVWGVDDATLTVRHDMGERCKGGGVIVEIFHSVELRGVVS